MDKKSETKPILEVKTNKGTSIFTAWELEELDEFLYNSMDVLKIEWYEITVKSE